MPKTLLNSVNEVFKKVGLISGDSFALTSLTDTSRQVAIDVAVQVINESIIDMYSTARRALPDTQAESTITLVAGTRAYTLASGFIELYWPLIDKTNAQFITEYKPGYNELLKLDLEQDDKGLPHFGAISPVDKTLHLDRAPEAADAGNVYTYQYRKSSVLTLATDEVTFNDDIWTMMCVVFAERWRRNRRNQFDATAHNMALSRSIRMLNGLQQKNSYGSRY